MSVSSILNSIGLNQPSSNQTDWRSTVNQSKQDFEQLLSSIQQGDLSATQQAFSALQQLQSGAQSNPPPSTATLNSDMSALNQALQAGSQASAQDALTKLLQDLQASSSQNRHHHHHHHHHTDFGSQGNQASNGAGTTATTPASTTSNIQRRLS